MNRVRRDGKRKREQGINMGMVLKMRCRETLEEIGG